MIPPREPFADCRQAFEAWGEGRIRWDSLIDGEIWLADGTRCPIDQSPRRVPVEVSIPPGQPPYVPPELAETGGWVWPAIGVGCALLIVGLVVLIWTERRDRRPRDARAAAHHGPAPASDAAAATAADRAAGKTLMRDGDMTGRHHWLGEGDVDDNGAADAALVDAVTGLGEPREPSHDETARAVELPGDWPDHRGDRDRDPEATHPWRPA